MIATLTFFVFIRGGFGEKVVDTVKPLPSFSDEILRYILKLYGSYEILTSAVLVQLCNLVQPCKTDE